MEERIEELWNKKVAHQCKTNAEVSGFSQKTCGIPADCLVKHCRGKCHQNGSDSDIADRENILLLELSDGIGPFGVDIFPLGRILFPEEFDLSLLLEK